MKYTYYKIESKQAQNYWVVDEHQLKQDIVDWLSDDDTLTITAVQMSIGEFQALPEYEG